MFTMRRAYHIICICLYPCTSIEFEHESYTRRTFTRNSKFSNKSLFLRSKYITYTWFVTQQTNYYFSNKNKVCISKIQISQYMFLRVKNSKMTLNGLEILKINFDLFYFINKLYLHNFFIFTFLFLKLFLDEPAIVRGMWQGHPLSYLHAKKFR